MKLGNSGLYVNGEGPIHDRCLLGVYYSQTPKCHNDYVTSSFEGVSLISCSVVNTLLT